MTPDEHKQRLTAGNPLLNEMNAEEVYVAVCRNRDRNFALMLAQMVVLASKTCPDEIRAAFADVFDLKLWEEQAARIEGKYAGLISAEQQRCQRSLILEQEVAELKRLTEAQQEQIDALRSELETVKTYLRGRPWKPPQPAKNGKA